MKNCKRFRVAHTAVVPLLCLVSVFCLAPVATANTPQAQFHLGRIQGNSDDQSNAVEGIIITSTWTAARSPYYVTAACTVAVGNTLTIEPGVTLLFNKDVPFVVEGNIIINGTETDSVRFLPRDMSEWGGLRIMGSQDNRMSYTRISGANGINADGAYLFGGLRVRDAEVEMDHCVLSGNRNSQAGGGLLAQDSYVTLADCVVRGNYSGNKGGGIFILNSCAELTDTEISGNEANEEGGGLSVMWNSEVSLTNCLIDSNTASDWKGGGVFIHAADLIMNRCVLSRNTSPNGAGVFISDTGNVALVNCTIAGNTCDSPGSGVYIWKQGALTAENSIIWDNGPGANLYMRDGAEIGAMYSDIAGGPTGSGNIDTDPLFWNAAEGNVALRHGSPCIDAGNPASDLDPDSTRADMGAIPYTHRGYGEMNVQVCDVPFDQGGRVKIAWLASPLDTNVNTTPHYSIWRASPENLIEAAREARAADGPEPTIPDISKLLQELTSSLGNIVISGIGNGDGTIDITNDDSDSEEPPVYEWEWLADVPAHRLERYSYTAETLYDSCAATPGVHYFMVAVHTSDPDVFYDSDVVAGYSVDNIAPLAPVALSAVWQDGTVKVTWTTEDTDVQDYRIYRCASRTEDIAGLEPVSTVDDTIFVDTEPLDGTAYYFISAVDESGNIGDAVSMQYTGPVSAEDAALPTDFALYQNAPNPFNPVTRINFDLPEACHVRLAVYNTSGQRVRVLSDGARSAGRFNAVWNGTDDNGRNLASGVYIYRLSAGSRVFTKRMTLVR